MEIIRPPEIDTRPDQPTMGIRTIAPFKGMSKVVDGLAKEMAAWVVANAIQPAGPPFLRLHVIDMRGEMDLSYGFPVAVALPDDGRIKADVLPGGRYASLVYVGGGTSGNRALIEWIGARDDIRSDRWDTAQGDNFRGRYESFLTDSKVEPRKTKRHVEVAIRVIDK